MKRKISNFFHRKLDKEHHGEQPPEVKGMSHFEKAVSQKKDTKNIEKAKIIASAVSALVVLHYQKKNGTIKKRRVTIRRIWQKGEEILVDGFCHEKKAPRIFKVSNIKKIVDVNTKEVFLQPKQFLLGQVATVPSEALAGHDSTARAINRVRFELTGLVFLAHIDGSFDESEMKVVENYFKKRCKDIRYDLKEVNKYIQRLYPDEESFYEAIEAIFDQPVNVLQVFVETFIKLILADGIIHDDEREFLAELLQTLREEGIELNIAGF